MTNEEIYNVAYDLVISGAESHAEDWLNENGEVPEDQYEETIDAQLHLVRVLRDTLIRTDALRLALGT